MPATALYDPDAVTPVGHVKWARLLKYSLYAFGWAVLLFVVIQDIARFRRPTTSLELMPTTTFTVPTIVMCSFGQLDLSEQFSPRIAYKDGWWFNAMNTSLMQQNKTQVNTQEIPWEYSNRTAPTVGPGSIIAWTDGNYLASDFNSQSRLWATFRIYGNDTRNWCMLQSQYHLLYQSNATILGSRESTQLTPEPFPVDIYFNGSFESRYAVDTAEYPYVYMAFPEMASRFDGSLGTWQDIFAKEGDPNSDISQYLAKVVGGDQELRNSFSVVPINSVVLMSLQRTRLQTLRWWNKFGIPGGVHKVSYIPASLSTKEIRDSTTLTYIRPDNSTYGVKQFSPDYLKVNHQISLRLVRTDTRTQQVDQVPAFLALPSQLGGIVSFVAAAYLFWMHPIRPDLECRFAMPGWETLCSLAAVAKCICTCGCSIIRRKGHNAAVYIPYSTPYTGPVPGTVQLASNP